MKVSCLFIHWVIFLLFVRSLLKILLALLVCVCVCVCVCVHTCAYKCLRRPEQVIGSPEAVVTGDCDLLGISAKKQLTSSGKEESTHFFFLRQGFSNSSVYAGTHSVHQAGLKFSEIHLPLSPKRHVPPLPGFHSFYLILLRNKGSNSSYVTTFL